MARTRVGANETRESILLAAERLFSLHGYEGASLRRVTVAAKVNLALVNYHFGGKEELFREVFRQRLGPVNQRRLALLAEAEKAAGGRPPPVREILRCLLEPVAEFAGPGARPHPFVRLLGRTMLAPPPFFAEVMREQFDGILSRFGALLQRALPDVPPPTLYWRLRATMGAALFSFARVEPLEPRMRAAGVADSGATMLEEMLACFEGGLCAPAPGGRGGPVR